MAIEENLLELSFRKNLIEEITGDENNTRMEQSLRDCDVYNGKMREYIKSNFYHRFPAEVVREIPIVSGVNISKKIVNTKAALYNNSPERNFTDLSDEQLETVNLIYRDMGADNKYLESNRYFEVQDQNHVMVIPKSGKLYMRTLKNHQLNVVPEMDNPEKAAIFILSSYDKDKSNLAVVNSDDKNQVIGDNDDYDPSTRRFIVWSSSYHFVMDGSGAIITDEIENPIAPVIPIVEVARDKDFEYWAQDESEITDFTLFFNEALSMHQQISEMQGFAQAYLKAPSDLMPEYVNVGPNRILKLVTNPDLEQNSSSVEFGYANPGSDLVGSQNNIESLLAMFLSSQGIDTSSVTGKADGAKAFSSGIERLLAMVDKFESARDVMDIYKNVESEIYQIIKAWLALNTDLIDQRYQVTLPEQSELSVVYAKPESITTENERLDLIERKIDLGVMSRVDAVMLLEEIEKEDAEKRIEEIDAQEFERAPVIEEQDITEIQP